MGNVLHLSAPLIVTREELSLAIAILDDSLTAVELEMSAEAASSRR
jgi:4-aminobutyrate aminotransferase-like enzyme